MGGCRIQDATSGLEVAAARGSRAWLGLEGSWGPDMGGTIRSEGAGSGSESWNASRATMLMATGKVGMFPADPRLLGSPVLRLGAPSASADG